MHAHRKQYYFPYTYTGAIRFTFFKHVLSNSYMLTHTYIPVTERQTMILLYKKIIELGLGLLILAN